MKRADVLIFGASAVMAATGALMLIVPRPPNSSGDAAAFRPGEVASLFEGHLSSTDMAAVRSHLPADAQPTPRPLQPTATGTQDTADPTLGDFPIPDRVAGLEWKSVSVGDLATAVAHGGALDAVELHQAMRALVARLRTSSADLEVAVLALSDVRDVDVRRIFLIALGRTDAPKAYDALLALCISSSDRATRTDAIRSLAQCGNEPYLDAPLPMLQRVPYVNAFPAKLFVGRAAEMLPGLLAQEKDPNVLAALISVLSDTQAAPRSARWREHEVDGKRVGKLIADYATNASDAGVRVQAVRALLYTQSPEAVAAMSRALLHDSDATVRESAARSLAGISGHEQVFKCLSQAVFSEPNAAVRGPAVTALSSHLRGERAAEAAETILRVYRQDADADVRRACIHTFWRMGEAGMSSLQTAAASDADPSVRQYARELMERQR